MNTGTHAAGKPWAHEGGAELVVAENLKDFPSASMPEGIRAVSADELLSELLER